MHLIFDLDGTLIDSLPGIAASLNHALAQHDLPSHPLPAVRDFIGNGTFETARRSLPGDSPETLAREIEAAFKPHYADHWPTGTTLYPGIAELVRELKNDGHQLAVLSNKPHPFTVEITRHFFPDGEFDPILGQKPEFPRKPAPDAALHLCRVWGIDPAKARFIGDSTVDRHTAEAAGIPFVAVGWGYHDPEHLGALVASDANHLRSLLS